MKMTYRTIEVLRHDGIICKTIYRYVYSDIDLANDMAANITEMLYRDASTFKDVKIVIERLNSSDAAILIKILHNNLMLYSICVDDGECDEFEFNDTHKAFRLEAILKDAK